MRKLLVILLLMGACVSDPPKYNRRQDFCGHEKQLLWITTNIDKSLTYRIQCKYCDKILELTNSDDFMNPIIRKDCK